MALPTEAELKEARGKAVDAKLVADAKQEEANKARKYADGLMHHYEQMLAEFQGQLAFDTEDT